MTVVVRAKVSGDYLEVPQEVRVGDNHIRQLYKWTSDIATAARFANRLEAKATMRRIRPGDNLKDYTFHQA